MSNFLDHFRSGDGKSSILDKTSTLLSIASLFFPALLAVKTLVDVIDSIVDPDNKEDSISNYDVMGMLTAAMPSAFNSLTPAKLSKIASALGIAGFAIEKYMPNSKIVPVIEGLHDIVSKDNKDERFTDDDVLGLVAKVGLSNKNGIAKETLSLINNILGD